MVNGLIGQGLRIFVLITTNEEVGRLHPAISRPGRCLSTVRFQPLDALAATAWLSERGVDCDPGHPIALSDLYAIAAGIESTRRDPPIGFAA